MTCNCNEAYKCPKCESCFRCKHKSYFGDKGWFWLCPRRVKGPWRAHQPIDAERVPLFIDGQPVAGTDNVFPVGMYGGITQ